MKERKKKYVALWQVMQRECRRLVSRPLYLFCMVIAPLFCYLFFTTLMDSGLPQNLPAGVVDMDDSSTSRNIVRNLDAFSQTGVVAHYSNVTDARIAVQEGKIYGFFYIPKGLSAEAQSQRQPKISFYTNYSYLIAGSLLFRDMKMMGELTAGSAARSVLYAKGATEDQAMGFLQPIVIDTHPLNNPWLNYSVYLCNTLIPGVLMLLIFMVTVYSIGVEIKDRTAREWLRMSNNSIYIALAGKLLPHTVVFFIMGIFYNVYLYGFLHFPCNSGIFPMIFATLCLVLASQCCGIVMIGTLPTPPRIKFCLLVGSDFILHLRFFFSGDGNESCFAGLEQPVSVTSLFPDLCRSGAQRIQHGLLMVQLYGIINIHDASLLCGSPLERSIGLL